MTLARQSKHKMVCKYGWISVGERSFLKYLRFFLFFKWKRFVSCHKSQGDSRNTIVVVSNTHRNFSFLIHQTCSVCKEMAENLLLFLLTGMFHEMRADSSYIPAILGGTHPSQGNRVTILKQPYPAKITKHKYFIKTRYICSLQEN